MHRFSTICFLVVVAAISSTLAEEKISCRLDSTCPKGYKCNSKKIKKQKKQARFEWYNIIFSSHCVPKDGENVDTTTAAPNNVTSNKSAAPGSAATTAAALATTAGPAASGAHPAGPAASGVHPAGPAASGVHPAGPVAASSATTAAAPSAGGETTAPPAAATTKGEPAIVKI